MAKQAENLVVGILREIQSTLAGHTRTLADHTKRFELLEEGLDEVREGMLTALGLASHAHVRDESNEEGHQRSQEAS